MTNNAKIIIGSRNVKLPFNDLLTHPYQHLFLLYQELGKPTLFISGGPKNNNFLTGDIYVNFGEYTSTTGDGKDNTDFTECQVKSKCNFATQIEGDAGEIYPKWQQMELLAKSINQHKIDYSIPFTCGLLKFFYTFGAAVGDIVEDEYYTENTRPSDELAERYLCNTANSNAVVAELLRHTKIEMVLPTHPDTSTIDAPGKDGQIFTDNFDFSQEKLNALQSQAERIIDSAVEAQRQMQEEGIRIPPSTGNYVQDVLDIAAYTNEILSRSRIIGENEEQKEEI